jgi:hypothetical protein
VSPLDHAPVPAGPTPRIGLRLAVMIAVIVLLAALAVLVRSKLQPDLANTRGNTATAGLAAPESTLIGLVDTEREHRGCGALAIDSRLTASAAKHATDMAHRGYAGETAPDGSGPQQRATAAGYGGGVVEIVAAGIATPAQVYAQWTNPDNPASLAVVSKMTDCSRLSVGIGHDPGRAVPAFGPGIWVVDLGNR